MCKLTQWNLINPIHGPSVECSFRLPMSFARPRFHFNYPHIHFSKSGFSVHQKLPFWQHSLQPHTAVKLVSPFCIPFLLICAKEWCHPVESIMFNKCNRTKTRSSGNKCWTLYIFLPLFSNSTEHEHISQCIKA